LVGGGMIEAGFMFARSATDVPGQLPPSQPN
jgi:hypothetical protein